MSWEEGGICDQTGVSFSEPVSTFVFSINPLVEFLYVMKFIVHVGLVIYP